MKIIISERQQKLISESVMGKFIESMIPELDKLNRKSDYSRKKYGHNEIYYNKMSLGLPTVRDQKYLHLVHYRSRNLSDPREFDRMQLTSDDFL